MYNRGRPNRLLTIVDTAGSILDSLHVALISTTYYYYTVTNYGDYYMPERVTWYALRLHYARMYCLNPRRRSIVVRATPD